MSWAGCQNNLIDANFQLQKSLEIFDKKISWQNLIKKDKGWKVPTLMPIRVKKKNLIFGIVEDNPWYQRIKKNLVCFVLEFLVQGFLKFKIFENLYAYQVNSARMSYLSFKMLLLCKEKSW